MVREMQPWEGVGGHKPRKPLETAKGKEMDSFLELSEKNTALPTP